MALHFGVLSTWAGSCPPLQTQTRPAALIQPPLHSRGNTAPDLPAPIPQHKLATGPQILTPVLKTGIKNNSSNWTPSSYCAWVWDFIDGLVFSCKRHVTMTSRAARYKRECKPHSGQQEGENNNYNLLSWKAAGTAVMGSASRVAKKTKATPRQPHDLGQLTSS